MKCMKCHNTLHSETGEFSMTINGKSIKVINAPVLHCKNCNSVIISDEVKEKAKVCWTWDNCNNGYSINYNT